MEPVYAVLTGDIRNSTRMPETDQARLPQALKLIFSNLSDQLRNKGSQLESSIFRGDSFQLVTDPIAAIDVALGIRAGLRAAFPAKAGTAIDCRIAIGIGTVRNMRENITESSGEAFLVSGRLLENMGKTFLMRIETPHTEATQQLNILLALCDVIVKRWTYRQALLVPDLINDATQTGIAATSGTSQAAVASKINAMGWQAISQFRAHYTEICRLNNWRIINP
ncbi:MAG: hypothetical protein JNL22_08300 [Bacteroidales bacterium]|nr:hypothetical protein [Bacteroidales bacterium]